MQRIKRNLKKEKEWPLATPIGWGWLPNYFHFFQFSYKNNFSSLIYLYFFIKSDTCRLTA
jgi:hypothetical protein